jgi:hypothetical protein
MMPSQTKPNTYLDDCPLNEGPLLLHEKTGVQLRDGGCTVESIFWIFTGFHLLPPASKRAITLIISPLMAIEQDQALDLNRLFGNACLPLAVDRKNNTPGYNI